VEKRSPRMLAQQIKKLRDAWPGGRVDRRPSATDLDIPRFVAAYRTCYEECVSRSARF